jgi:hypothetical protein
MYGYRERSGNAPHPEDIRVDLERQVLRISARLGDDPASEVTEEHALLLVRSCSECHEPVSIYALGSLSERIRSHNQLLAAPWEAGFWKLLEAPGGFALVADGGHKLAIGARGYIHATCDATEFSVTFARPAEPSPLGAESTPPVAPSGDDPTDQPAVTSPEPAGAHSTLQVPGRPVEGRAGCRPSPPPAAALGGLAPVLPLALVLPAVDRSHAATICARSEMACSVAPSPAGQVPRDVMETPTLRAEPSGQLLFSWAPLGPPCR